MNIVKNFFTRHAIMAPASFTVWLLLLFNSGFGFLASTALGIAMYAGGNAVMKEVQLRSALKQYGLARSEYKHIQQQVKEAKTKVKRLASMYGQVRSIQAFRQVYDMAGMSRRIIKIVQHNPRKFYQTENFFYAHLDSAVEITSKYSLLVNQQLKDQDIKIALQNTRETLNELNKELEKDLKNAVATDLQQLRMEIDFVDVTLNKDKPLLESKGEQKHDK